MKITSLVLHLRGWSVMGATEQEKSTGFITFKQLNTFFLSSGPRCKKPSPLSKLQAHEPTPHHLPTKHADTWEGGTFSSAKRKPSQAYSQLSSLFFPIAKEPLIWKEGKGPALLHLEQPNKRSWRTFVHKSCNPNFCAQQASKKQRKKTCLNFVNTIVLCHNCTEARRADISETEALVENTVSIMSGTRHS